MVLAKPFQAQECSYTLNGKWALVNLLWKENDLFINLILKLLMIVNLKIRFRAKILKLVVIINAFKLEFHWQKIRKQ